MTQKAVPKSEGAFLRPLKTEKRSGPLQAGGSARPHCLCDMRRHSGTVARARQVRGVRHCKSLAALNVPRVYVGAAERRSGRFCSPALVCPDRSTGPDFCPWQLFSLSLRELVRTVASSAHVQRGRIVSVVLREQVRLFARVFHGQVFRLSGRGVFSCARKWETVRSCALLPMLDTGKICPFCPRLPTVCPYFMGNFFLSTFRGVNPEN